MLILNKESSGYFGSSPDFFFASSPDFILDSSPDFLFSVGDSL
jgi:hypothetical protein